MAVVALMVTANIIIAKRDDNPTGGQTTEIAVLLIFAIGAYLVLGDRLIAVIVGGMLAILLYIKETLHGFIDRLKDKDLAAIMTFVGISLVILPILPDKTYGPLDVLNPRDIWLMVTLIVGISLLGYFIYKWVGKKTGMLSNGILGGIISSTATAVSFARNSKSSESIAKVAAFVVLTAVTVSLIRVIVIIGVVAPNSLMDVILPFIVLFIFMAFLSGVVFYFVSKEKEKENEEMPEPKNPAQFKSAFVFGLLYGAILLAVAFAEEEFGDSGLYIVSIIGGLAKKDAITVSLAQSMAGGMDTELVWKLIMTGVLSNLAFKIGIAYVLGSRKFGHWMAVTLGISIVVGVLMIFFWPDAWHF